jgi:hypothetical protein
MTRDGVVSPLPMLARRTSENAFGFSVPTPLKSDALKAKFKRSSLLKGTFGANVSSFIYWTAARYGRIPSLDLCHWLIGWPIGWTELRPLATDKSPYAPPKHSEFLPETETV